MKLNDCTNCLNRERCSVRGGPGQYCRGEAKGYIHGEWANGHGAGLVPDESERKEAAE